MVCLALELVGPCVVLDFSVSMEAFDGHEFEQAPGVGDGQGGLTCCNPWGHKESDMAERLN